VWLVNTGWTGGPYGTGSRISIKYSRAVIDAALTGALADVDYRRDPVFGFDVPESCPAVPSEVLDPQRTWPNGDAYASAAADLASRFADNFTQYSDLAAPEVRAAGPKPA
jgi:phosphoenolpyruvate carboxykinase (ATP)